MFPRVTSQHEVPGLNGQEFVYTAIVTLAETAASARLLSRLAMAAVHRYRSYRVFRLQLQLGVGVET